MPPRNIKEVLQKKLEEKEREKARLQKAGGAAASGSVPSKKVPPPPPSKKRPLSAPPSPKEPSASKKVRAATKGKGQEVEHPKEAAAEGEGRVTAFDLDTPWVPSFITPGKKQVLKSDSLREDPSLAFTLHSGLALPRDVQNPPSLKAALSEYYYHVGRATQSIMSAQLHLTEYDKKSKLQKQSVEYNKALAEEYKKGLEQSELVRQSLEVQVANQNDLIKGLQESTKQTRAEGKDEGLAEGRALGREEMKKEMEKEVQGQYEKGYAQAEEDVTDQILEVQDEIKEAQHKESFMLGYNMGLDDAGVEADDERRSLVEIPPFAPAEVTAEETTADAVDSTILPAPADAPILPAQTDAPTPPAPADAAAD
ncbi:uncharacterized protein At3g60930, chloroplastic-like [Rhododendron vialii]|uniref:uncharacterized protein At3g60930, chloroplastic-like n=1 Tax=Rhododendron vialii TaxID=182163 RepID=UPI00265F8EBA|nr:uncharacterized protein At3g60930, chloroplastic-like [Rhododendron vialii]